MTEFGSLALIDMGQDEDENGKSIRLPGVKRGDHSSRHFKPEILVTCVRFSPTGKQNKMYDISSLFFSNIGRAWSACTTEGLLIYSIDSTAMFDPIDLNETITPLSIRQTLYEKNDSYMALLMALKLNEKSLITEIIENIDSSKGMMMKNIA
jgi:periodic tryptophan protein 2